MFVDEGPPMAALLEAAARARHRPRLRRAGCSPPCGGPRRADATPRQGLVDPLSERELDVLRLLGSDLAGPDIARELVVSLNTVRTHTKNIYAKLGVNSRRAAVRRSRGARPASRASQRADRDHHLDHHMW